MSKIQNGFIGLFWLSEDSSHVVNNTGEVEFFVSDIATKNTVLPAGTHRSYGRKPYNLPRGRIEVEKGKVIISVGLSCPDSTVEEIIKSYYLNSFRDVIEVKRSSFWDKRF